MGAWSAMEPPHGEAFPRSTPRRMRRGEGEEGGRGGEREVRVRGKGWWRVKEEEVEEMEGRVVEEWLEEDLPVGCPALQNASRGSLFFTTKQKKGVKEMQIFSLKKALDKTHTGRRREKAEKGKRCKKPRFIFYWMIFLDLIHLFAPTEALYYAMAY